jgi:hypothetical protein
LDVHQGNQSDELSLILDEISKNVFSFLIINVQRRKIILDMMVNKMKFNELLIDVS